MTGLRNRTGYGRTRCPKNLVGAHGTEVADGAGRGTGNPVGATDGLGTENQRFLHMILDTSGFDEDITVTVYGYNYAFGVWMPLAETGVAGTAITISADYTVAHKTVDIAGTDRVYFKLSGDTPMDTNNEFFAACSTF